MGTTKCFIYIFETNDFLFHFIYLWRKKTAQILLFSLMDASRWLPILRVAVPWINAPNIASAKLCWHLDCRMTLQCPARRWHVWCWSRVWPEHCSSHQHSILRQLPGDSHCCHQPFYILHILCPVSCISIKLELGPERVTSKNTFQSLNILPRTEKVFTDVVKMTWQNWSELDHVSMVVLWKYSGRFKNMLEQCTYYLDTSLSN